MRFIEKNTEGVQIGGPPQGYVDPYTGSYSLCLGHAMGLIEPGASSYRGAGNAPATGASSYRDPYTGATRRYFLTVWSDVKF